MTHPPRSWKFDRFEVLPPGVWKEEPDKLQWVDEATDLDCLIVRNRAGALCGYVGVPPGHRMHGVEFQDIEDELTVHGGLTFSNSCAEDAGDEAVCHVPYPGREPDVWWLGFDCNHAWDIAPAFMELFQAMRRETVGYLRDEEYRDIEYVKQECRQLAQQLKE